MPRLRLARSQLPREGVSGDVAALRAWSATEQAPRILREEPVVHPKQCRHYRGQLTTQLMHRPQQATVWKTFVLHFETASRPPGRDDYSSPPWPRG